MSIARLVLLASCVMASNPALAATFSHDVCATSATDASPIPRAERIWSVRFDAAPPAPLPSLTAAALIAFDETQGSPRAKAVEYSHGYAVRLKVHKVASFATLPLFVTQYVLGQKLYDGTSDDGVKTAHRATAIGVASLFGVNTFTGVWNLWEGRKEPAHRGRRIAHAIMMLGADAGFVATGMLAPGDDPNDYLDDRSTHRTVAITSMAVATASYLMMLFWN